MALIVRQFLPNEKHFFLEVYIDKIEFTGIRPDGKPSFGYDHKKSVLCRALIDTGATKSVISEEIAKELNLRVSGKTTIQTASDSQHEANQYNTIFAIPFDNGYLVKTGPKENDISHVKETKIIPLTVTGNKYITEQGIQAIIGMDIISLGHLTLISGGKLVFSI